MTATPETRRLVLHAPDGSMTSRTIRDAAIPEVAASPEAWAKLRKLLAPLVLGPGELAIVTSSGDTDGRLVPAVMLAADEIMVPNATVSGHAGTQPPALPPSAMPDSMLERIERNVVEVGSNSFQLAIVGHPTEWLEWGQALARRHRLRLQVWLAPSVSIPAAFRHRALVFKARRVIRLLDGRSLSYRELGQMEVKADPGLPDLLSEGRRQLQDAAFDLAVKDFEPGLREMGPERAEKARKAMREIWRAVHGAGLLE